MTTADFIHNNPALAEKLAAIYKLNLHKKIDLGFRPPYLRLLEGLGNPHKRLPPTVHVAGTNGKGSTIAFMKNILEAQGYSVHAYTSPHLVQFNERIVLNNKVIQDDTLLTLIDRVMDANEGGEITFFEFTTALAFTAFSEHKADILLLETGMGGRLDCTNVIEQPKASVITSIAMDHTDYLGSTIQEIANEKAGIIKRNAPCIVGAQSVSGVNDIFKKQCKSKGCKVFLYSPDWVNGTFLTHPKMQGAHQKENLALAIKALKQLKDFTIQDVAYQKGAENTHWSGRIDNVLNLNGWEVWLDGGHNEDAARALSKWMKESKTPIHVIIGMKNDKSPDLFLKHISPCAQSLHTTSLEANSYKFKKMRPWQQLIKEITNKNAPPARILICGSLYLVGEVLRQKDDLHNCISR